MAVAEFGEKKLTAIERQQLFVRQIEQRHGEIDLVEAVSIDKTPPKIPARFSLGKVVLISLLVILPTIFLGIIAFAFITKTPSPLHYSLANFYYIIKVVAAVLVFCVAQLFFVTEIIYNFLHGHLVTIINGIDVPESLNYLLLPEPYSRFGLIVSVVAIMVLVYFCAKSLLSHFSKVLWHVVLCCSVLTIVYLNLDLLKQKNTELVEFLITDIVSVKL